MYTNWGGTVYLFIAVLHYITVLPRAAFGMKIMCPSCDTSRAIAHALWRLLSNDLNDTLLTGMLNAARFVLLRTLQYIVYVVYSST